MDRLGKDDECALLLFGTNVKEIIDFTRDHDRIKKALAALSPSDQQTHLYQGVFDSLDRAGNAPSTRSAVVLITDGRDEGSLIGIQEVLAKITSHDVPVYTLGYGKDADVKTL